MIVCNYLSTESIIIDPKVTDKGDVIRILATRLLGLDDARRDAVLKAVLEREAVMSTGVGNGIAIPHAKVDLLDNPIVAIASLNTPVDFDSPDGKPVDLVFLVAGSTNGNSQHLKILSALSRILIQHNFVVGLRNCRTSNEIFDKIQLADSHAVPS
jgi:fructose-specific phosphotransferase system IIA component